MQAQTLDNIRKDERVGLSVLEGSCCFVVMAALCYRAGHYILALWFLSFFLSFFPRLISAVAVAEWMSTILPHMVWP